MSWEREKALDTQGFLTMNLIVNISVSKMTK